MEIPPIFGDAGTNIISSFFKNNGIKWLPGWIFVFLIILSFLSQEPSLPHARVAEVVVEYLQLYLPFIRNYLVPTNNFLIVIYLILILVYIFFSNIICKFSLPLVILAKRCMKVLLVLIIPISMLCISFMIFSPIAGINQFLAHYNHLWLLLLLPLHAFAQVNPFWSLFVLSYLFFFLSNVFNSIDSWDTSTNNNNAVIGASATEDIGPIDLNDRNCANRYINERSISINSMRDQFANNLNAGQAYLSEVASLEGCESIDKWIEKHARDAAIKEAQSIKRENRDQGSNLE